MEDRRFSNIKQPLNLSGKIHKVPISKGAELTKNEY